MAGPYRILIIEDDPEHAELIRMGFRRHDEFFLDFATTGEEGLEMIANTAYDLISVDLVLPGIGGLDVLVKIRKLDPDIPVVMVSGHGTTEMAVVPSRTGLPNMWSRAWRASRAFLMSLRT